jgi:hypothetical protein
LRSPYSISCRGWSFKTPFFRITGRLVTSGWSLQQWVTRAGRSGIWRRHALLLRTPGPLREAVREHFVAALLWAAALTMTACIVLASFVHW